MATTAVEGRDVYVKAALFGLSLFLVTILIFFVGVMIGDPSAVGFIPFFLVPALIIGAALLFLRRWGLLLGILGGVFGLLIMSENVGLYVGSPNAFFDFSSTLFGIIGVLILLVASVIGTVQYFRGQVPTELSPAFVTAGRALVGVLVALSVISVVLTGLSADKVSAADKQGATVITAKKVDWDVDQVSGRANQPLKLVVRNDDPILHTFTIDGLDLDVKLTPWSEHVVEINAPAGIYGYICRVVGHEEDMTGALTIQ